MSLWQRHRAKILAAITVAIVAVAAVQLYSVLIPVGPPAKPGITLVIITRHDTAIWETYEGSFLASEYAKRHNIAALKWLQPSPGLWKDVITKGEVSVDVAWGGGPTLFDQLIRDNLLDPLDDQELLGIVGQIEDTIGGAPMKRRNARGEILWVAAAISSFGFTVNRDFLERHGLPLPKRWEDLASVEFGKLLPTATLSMADAPLSTSNTRIYEIIIQAFGWEKGWEILTRMAANANIYGGSVETQAAVEGGQVAVGMSIDFYGYTSQLRNPRAEYVLPLGQSLINGDPIALVKGSKNRAAAQAFISFVLSREGQALWLSERVNRMPVRGDAFETEMGRKRLDLARLYEATITNIGIPFNDDLALSYEVALQQYFKATLTDAHGELVRAWKAIVDAKLAGKLTEAEFEELASRLGALLTWTEDGQAFKFTQEYAQSINERLRTDPAFLSKMLSIWRSAAIAKYDAVYQLVQQMVKG